MVAYSPLDRNDAGVKNKEMDGGEAGSFWRASKKIQIFLSVKGVPIILSNSAKHKTMSSMLKHVKAPREQLSSKHVQHYYYLTPWQAIIIAITAIATAAVATVAARCNATHLLPPSYLHFPSMKLSPT
jgi:hypothetical protein